MNKTKFLGGLVAFLLFINICLCALMINSHSKRDPHQGPRDHIIKKLHLNASQIGQYDILIAAHRTDIDSRQKAIGNLKNSLYALLKDQNTSGTSDTLIVQINRLQKEIEYIHLRHFRDIQQLCSADQQNYFNELCSEITQLFSPRPPDKK
ncbi:MAG: hypothetical protein IT257_02935 [Chitinophagaceae bacterium]|nr:hypothetical protein [Chitinophagaceae bacterium]